MALTEKQEWKVEVVPPYCTLQVRRADIIERDGVEIARSYHRHVVAPGADVTSEPEVVQKVAQALHDQAMVTAYTTAMEEAQGY